MIQMASATNKQTKVNSALFKEKWERRNVTRECGVFLPALPNTPQMEYLEALSSRVPPSAIISCGRIGGNIAVYFVSSTWANLVLLHGVDINNQHVQAIPIHKKPTKVFISSVAPELPDKLIKDFLSQFGRVVSWLRPIPIASNGKAEWSHVVSLRRETHIILKADAKLPSSHAFVFEDLRYTVYISTDLVCFKCKQTGHISNACQLIPSQNQPQPPTSLTPELQTQPEDVNDNDNNSSTTNTKSVPSPKGRWKVLTKSKRSADEDFPPLERGRKQSKCSESENTNTKHNRTEQSSLTSLQLPTPMLEGEGSISTTESNEVDTTPLSITTPMQQHITDPASFRDDTSLDLAVSPDTRSKNKTEPEDKQHPGKERGTTQDGIVNKSDMVSNYTNEDNCKTNESHAPFEIGLSHITPSTQSAELDGSLEKNEQSRSFIIPGTDQHDADEDEDDRSSVCSHMSQRSLPEIADLKNNILNRKQLTQLLKETYNKRTKRMDICKQYTSDISGLLSQLREYQHYVNIHTPGHFNTSRRINRLMEYLEEFYE